MGINGTGKSLKIESGKVTYLNHITKYVNSAVTRHTPYIYLGDIGLLYDNLGIAPINGIYDVGVLCTSTNINKHSLIKPFYAVEPGLTPDDLVTLNVNGISYPYGYRIPSTTSGTASDLLRALTGSGSEWVFYGPEPSSWKSMAHFDGYSHDAVAGVFPIATLTSRMSDSTTHILTISWGGNRYTDNVHPVNMASASVSDGGRLGDLKVGVAIYYSLNNGSTWSYLKSIDSGKTASTLGMGGTIETSEIELKKGISAGNLPNSENDITLRLVPFMHSGALANTVYTSTARKWSIRIYDSKGYRDILLEAFTWAMQNYAFVASGIQKKLSFRVKITGGTGTTNLSASDFEVIITTTPDYSGSVAEEREEYRSTCCVGSGTGTLFTLNNQSGTGSDNVELRTASAFTLKSNTYYIEVRYKGISKGMAVLTI